MLSLSFTFYLVLALGAVAIPLGLFVSMMCVYQAYRIVVKKRPVVCWAWGGYTVFGISNPAFQESLKAVLAALQIAWKEHASGVEIPARGAVVKTTVSPKGVVTLETGDKDRVLLKEITDGLRRYYLSTSVVVTPQYTLIGTVVVVAGTILVIVALSAMMVSEKNLSLDRVRYSEQECTKQMAKFAAGRGIDATAFLTANQAFVHKCEQHIDALLQKRGK